MRALPGGGGWRLLLGRGGGVPLSRITVFRFGVLELRADGSWTVSAMEASLLPVAFFASDLGRGGGASLDLVS